MQNGLDCWKIHVTAVDAAVEFQKLRYRQRKENKTTDVAGCKANPLTIQCLGCENEMCARPTWMGFGQHLWQK